MLQKHPETNGLQSQSESVKQAAAQTLHVLQAQFDLNGKLLIETQPGTWDEAALWVQSHDRPEERAQVKRALKGLSVVWVPTEQVTLMQRFVPGKRRADWQNALPFALEESLAEPVEALHFVPLNRDAEGLVSVAIVTLERMRIWHEQLQQIGLEQALLVADCFRIPPAQQVLDSNKGEANNHFVENENQQAWSVFHESDQRILVRSGEYVGFAASPQWFEQMKQLSSQAQGNIEILPVDANQVSATCTLSQSVSRNPCAAFNLRTGAFQVKSQSSAYWKVWQWPAVVLLAVVGVYLISIFLQAQHHREQALAYQVQTERLFKERFPDVKRIINIRTQAKSGFQQSGGVFAGIGPGQLAKALESAFSQHDKVQIQRLDWRASSRQLSIQLQAPQVTDLQKLAQAVSAIQSSELKVKNVSQTLAEGVLYVDAN
ncbi:MAG: type II secretion system protein GspL [Thiomicrorhabdus chilensis]|uniref:type II secretion system protein GspL n=1 Tax=Thiomicrorhabdus chilensis TaxID=63656 RepID=UPI00299E7A6B|nr:type II secretion system protein GspL [Thiomicrorhabdus chilensis]MDX1347649.1 type II secretion system protein GspL [Thiomicrorhabdus chilensis]